MMWSTHTSNVSSECLRPGLFSYWALKRAINKWRYGGDQIAIQIKIVVRPLYKNPNNYSNRISWVILGTSGTRTMKWSLNFFIWIHGWHFLAKSVFFNTFKLPTSFGCSQSPWFQSMKEDSIVYRHKNNLTDENNYTWTVYCWMHEILVITALDHGSSTSTRKTSWIREFKQDAIETDQSI